MSEARPITWIHVKPEYEVPHEVFLEQEGRVVLGMTVDGAHRLFEALGEQLGRTFGAQSSERHGGDHG